MEAVLMRIAVGRSSDRSDQELAERAISGDTRAYEQLVVRYQRLVYRILWSRGGDPQEIEDMAQETFMRAWERLGTFDPAQPFKAWIARVAGNLAIDHYRARSRRPVLVELPDEETAPLRAGDADPALVAQKLDDQRGLLEALRQVPPLYREALVLRFVEDLPYDEIATALGLPLGSVKTRIFRGREMLKQRLIAAGRETATESGV
jgi:RNA polymerase sigma-70 factor (ECF subfamily)